MNDIGTDPGSVNITAVIDQKVMKSKIQNGMLIQNGTAICDFVPKYALNTPT